MLTREFVQDGRTTRFTVTRDASGWDVREERDNTLVKQSHYSDWHRVERAMQTVELLGAGRDGTNPRPSAV
jgi:hypothetical protein